jgi:signal transduction histidine kinase
MLRRTWRRFGDLVVAVAFLAAAGVEIASDHKLDPAQKAGAAAMALAVAVAIAFRVRAPLALAAVTLASMLLRPLIPPGGDGAEYGLPALLAAYTCAAHLDGWELKAGAVLSAGIAIDLMVTEGGDFGGVVFYTLLFGAPWTGGRLMRMSRQREVEKARAAVTDERQRIARELHDVVAHAISVVILQARGGRKMLASDPAAAAEAFDVIEATGGQALAEMRRLLGLLRTEDDQALAPLPTLGRVDDLAGEIADAGLPVEVEVAGERPPLPPGIDVSAYRIVQEALTNALKHAGPARARVRVAYEPDAVLVEVTDDGVGTTVPAAPGSGHGLVGIRERVAIVGGEVDAGPRPDGGYVVRARLPYAVHR